jgi:DNA-binding CsgD family transcriptional regulator
MSTAGPSARLATFAPDADWPFVGRDADLDRVRDTLAAGGSVVLAGATGAGKSRLALAAVQRAADDGFETARVSATRGAATIPFGAIAPLIPSVLAQTPGSVDSRADWLWRCVRALSASGPGRRRVLLVDDLHWLDSASATVIHQAVAMRAVQLVGTLRSGEAAPDAVVALWKDALAVRHELGDLSQEQVERLLELTLGDPIDRGAILRLLEHSGGNLLFLRELVRGALAAGSLRHADHLWRLTGPIRMSDRLIELVEVRLGDLMPQEREVLEVVAVGEPVGLAALKGICDERSLEEIERRGFVTTGRDGRRLLVSLSHPIYGDCLLERMPNLRRRRIARELARTTEAAGARRREDTLRLARWRLEGGGAEPGLLLRAAEAARWSYDFALAEQLADAAVTAGAGFEAVLLAAQLAFLQGRGEQAEAMLRPLALQADDDPQRARVALARVDAAIFAGRADLGLDIADEAERALSAAVWRDEITARRSGLLFAVAGPDAAAEVAAPLLARSHGRALVYSALVACLALGRIGRVDAAIAAADRGLQEQLLLPSTLENYPWLHVFFRGDALIYAGRLDAAERAARERYDEGVRRHSTEAQAYFGCQLARILIERGQLDPGVQMAREASALFAELGRPILLERCLVDLISSLAMSRRADQATAALGALDQLGFSPSYYPADVARARAWVAITNGQLADARRELNQAAKRAEAAGDCVGALDALHLLARLGPAAPVLSGARRLAARIEGDRAAAQLAHVQALAAGDPDALDTVTTGFESLGLDLMAAETAAAAAAAADGITTSQRAAVLRRRAAALHHRVPAIATLGLQASRAQTELTPAETDTALLAAAGYSNREIASRLYLSVRTIEGRLQRCYEKLSVSCRADLSTALQDRGIDIAP